MIGHEAISVADPVIPFVDVLKGVEERFPIVVVLENRLLLVASGGHMVDSAGIFDAEGAGHRARIAEKVVNCNKRDLTLRCLYRKPGKARQSRARPDPWSGRAIRLTEFRPDRDKEEHQYGKHEGY